jgi:hypothetical protein
VCRGKLVVVDGWERGGGDFWGKTTMEWALRTIRRKAFLALASLERDIPRGHLFHDTSRLILSCFIASQHY